MIDWEFQLILSDIALPDRHIYDTSIGIVEDFDRWMSYLLKGNPLNAPDQPEVTCDNPLLPAARP